MKTNEQRFVIPNARAFEILRCSTCGKLVIGKLGLNSCSRCYSKMMLVDPMAIVRERVREVNADLNSALGFTSRPAKTRATTTN